MKISFDVVRATESCGGVKLTLDIPRLDFDFWVCVTVNVRVWWFRGSQLLSLHFK